MRFTKKAGRRRPADRGSVRRRRSAKAVASLVAGSLLAGLMVVIQGASPAAAAPLTQTTIITNNLQGASTDADKWQTVRDYIHAADIVLLQEVGSSGPGSAHEQPAIVTADGATVQHFQWQPDTADNPHVDFFQIYYAQTDRNGGTNTGGRVNNAIVTRLVPDEVRVVDNPVSAGRTALGVRFGNNWYFTFHGLSGGGGDSAGMLGAVQNAVNSWGPNYTWTVGGDFNLDPGLIPRGTQYPQGARTYGSGLATQQSGGELDYFVTSDTSNPYLGAHRLSGASPDHYAVMLGGLQAAADPPELKIMPLGDATTDDTYAKVGYQDAFMGAAGALAFMLSMVSNKRSLPVSFVGSQSGTTGGPPFVGAPGENIGAIAARTTAPLLTNHPNIVTLQAGTQDMKTGDTVGAPTRLAALVDQIRAEDSNVLIAVATLGPAVDPIVQARITAYNASIRQLVADRQAAGQHVVLADTSLLTTADLGTDGLTPNTAGDSKIAAAFADAILDALVRNWVADKPLKVLPFGDSITYGIGSSTSSSYRGGLQAILDDTGRNYQFVGSQASGMMAQPANEGHPGWTIDQLAGVEHCTIQSLLPNLVLLHIGTNDINQDLDLPHASDRLVSLINNIFSDDPGVTVLVGSLMGTTWSTTAAANQVSYNNAASAQVNSLRNSGKHVAWVDMNAVTTANMWDGLHPNDAGYQIMATAWSGAIEDATANSWLTDPTAQAGTASGTSCSGSSSPPSGAPGSSVPWASLGYIASGVVGGLAAGDHVQFADLNADGRADYIDIHADGSATAYLNSGTPNPAVAGPAGSSSIPWTPLGQIIGAAVAPGDRVQFADLNGDGRADYIDIHADSSVTAYLNEGPLSPERFRPPTASNYIFADLGYIASGVGDPGSQIQFTDLNGDGRADYIDVHPDSSVTAYLNGGIPPYVTGGADRSIPWTPLGYIASGVVGGAPGSQIRFADLNGDGRADYIDVHPDSSTTAYLNGGTPNPAVAGPAGSSSIPWTPLGQIASGVVDSAPGSQIQFADLNGDGRADYIDVHPDSSTTAYLNGAFVPGSTVPWTPLGYIASGVVGGLAAGDHVQFADLNGDGRADYINIHADGSATAYLNGGTPNPVVAGPAGSSSIPWTPLGKIIDAPVTAGDRVQFADLNGDGRADYINIHADSSVTAYLNEGPLSPDQTRPATASNYIFASLGYIASGVGDPGSQIQFADLNGDGRADYIDVHPDSSTTAYLNGGTPNPAVIGPAGSSSIPWTPLGYIASGVVGGAPGSQIRLADLNGDGRADYIDVHPDSSTTAYLNAGTPNPAVAGPAGSSSIPWTPLGYIASGVGDPGSQIQFADLNRDGRADYIDVHPDSSTTAYLNGSTPPPPVTATPPPQPAPATPTTAPVPAS